MKRLTLCTAFLTSVIAAPAIWAQQPTNPIYFGIKGGLMDLDDGGGIDEATNLGVFAGYTLRSDSTGLWAIEGEYTRTLSDGEIGNADWDIETLAGYITYRSVGDVFLKAKAGYGWWDVSVKNGSTVEADDWDFTYGAGVGFRFSNKNGLELEYTVVETDITFLSIGYYTHF